MGPKSHSLPGETVASSIFPPGPDDISDPFTGTPIGNLRSPPSKLSEDAAGDGASVTTPLKGASSSSADTGVSYGDSDAMWSQLAKIRQLQSDVAKMHMGMDGSGLDSGIKRGEARRPVEKDLKDASGSSIKQPSEDEFTSRRSNISAIMSKVIIRSARSIMFLTLSIVARRVISSCDRIPFAARSTIAIPPSSVYGR